MDVKLVWQTLGVALRSNIIRILTVHYYYITNLLDHILIARMEHVLFLYNRNRERSLLIFTIRETLVKNIYWMTHNIDMCLVAQITF
jgi:hypothetical protein